MAFQAIALGLSAASTVKGIFGSRKSARKQRRLLRRQIALQEGSLEFAKDQFEIFRPVIQQVSDFFTSVPIEDIVSGKVLSPETRAAVGAFQEASQAQEEQLEADLAQRGISDDVAGQVVRGQFAVEQARNLSDIVNRNISKSLDRRIAFGSGAIQAAGQVQGATNRLSRVISGQARTLGADAAAGASSAAASAGTLFDLLARNDRETPLLVESDRDTIAANESRPITDIPTRLSEVRG